MTIGLLSNSINGFRITDDTFMSPEFIGKITLNPTPVVLSEGGELSYLTYRYSGTLPDTSSRDTIIFWTLPSVALDIWYYPKDRVIPAGVLTTAIDVICKSTTIKPEVPEGYVFALGAMLQSPDTFGARSWDANGTLIFDSGKRQLNTYNATSGIDMLDSIAYATVLTIPGKPAFLLPDVTRVSETYAGYNTDPTGKSHFIEWLACSNRNGTTLNTRMVKVNDNTTHAADISSLTGYSEDVVYGNSTNLSITSINATTYDTSIPILSTEMVGQSYITPAQNLGNELLVGDLTYTRTYLGNSTDMSMYNYEEDLVRYADIPAFGTNINNSSTSEFRVGIINVPGEALYRSKKSTVTVILKAFDYSKLIGCRITVGFSTIRTSASHRVYKLIPSDNTSKTVTLEFTMEPNFVSQLYIDQVSDLTAPTYYPDNSGGQMFDLNMLYGVEMPIYIKYDNYISPITSIIESVTAFISMPKAIKEQVIPGVEYRKPYEQPFVNDDLWNLPISKDALVLKPAFCHSWTTGGDSWGSGTVNAYGQAGSDIVTVYSSANIKVGMFPVLSEHTGYSESDVSASMHIQTKLSRETFGVSNKVIAIIDATHVQMEFPLKARLMRRGIFYGIIYGIVFYRSVESISMQMGIDEMDNSNSLDTQIGLFTGITKTSVKCTAWSDRYPMTRVQPNDPIRNWIVGTINVDNGWLHRVSPETDIASVYGEIMKQATFSMKTPTILTNSYISLGAFNADDNLCIITEDGRYSIEFIGCTENVELNRYEAFRAVVVDLTTTSVAKILTRSERVKYGVSAGTRAYGGGLSGGVIRAHELAKCADSSKTNETTTELIHNIEVAMNAIPHAIAMVLCSSQLKSNNYCIDPLLQYNRTNYHSYISQIDKHKPGILISGSGYIVGDVLYVVGGSYNSQMRLTITSVGGIGNVLSVFVSGTGQYRTLPPDAANLTTTTSGSGIGCILTVSPMPGDITKTTISDAFPITASVGAMCEYPATSIDGGYAGDYSGSCAIGSFYTIDQTLDLAAKWKLARTKNPSALINSYEYLALLSAVQKYGSMSIDTAVNTHILAVMEAGINSTIANNISGISDAGTFNMLNMRDLKTRLLYIENVSPLGKGTAGFSLPELPLLYPTTVR